MKYYRVIQYGSNKLLGWCTESTIPKVEERLKGKGFYIREIPQSQYEEETKEIQFVY